MSRIDRLRRALALEYFSVTISVYTPLFNQLFQLTRQEQIMPNTVFSNILKFRVLILIIGTIAVGLAGSFLPALTRDTTADAFIPKDNPARVYREQVKETFGLADPIIIAIFQEGEYGVFTPQALQLVESLTFQLQDLENIDPERVVSLATENNIEGYEYGMKVEPFYENYPDTLETAQVIWEKVSDFPLYLGSLVARDGSATLIVAEVLDEKKSEATYAAIMELANNTALPEGLTLHVAGEAAITGYMGTYIDSDAQRLNPLAGLIITIILFLAFRTLAGALLPNLIVVATVVGAVGLMVAANVSFFVITNGMPVVLIGIAVADSIHIFSAYYEAINSKPGVKNNDAIISAMSEMWRPITLTSLTTIAGFLGLYISSVQPPMQYMGLFTALGVAIAWLYSMAFLPAAMSFFKAKTDNYLARKKSGDFASKFMTKLGTLVINKPELIVAVGVVLIFSGIAGAMQIKVDDRRIGVFNEKEPVYQADKIINAHFDGTSVFDIVIETDTVEGLFKPRFLKKMEAFQLEIESHAIVGGTTSIVDYLKQMNRSLNEGNPDEYRLVDDELLNAQLFLLYTASADPTDFEEEIDYDYQNANIRVNINKSSYLETKPFVASINHYIQNTFNEPGLKATLSGRAMVTYEWVNSVGTSHFNSVLVSLALVLLMASLVFRSLTAGLLSLAPVAISILFVYAVMVIFSIDIGIGTSMFASVAIGLGVDFAIHTIDRLRELFKQPYQPNDEKKLLLSLFPSTGRALFFNLLAIACGFGVLMSSEVVPLMRFGAIVALSVSTAFIFSLTFLPALVVLTKPRFIYRQNSPAPLSNSVIAGILLTMAFGFLHAPDAVFAQEMSALDVMSKVVTRNDGAYASRNLTMQLIDKRGKSRVRKTRGFRKYFGEDKRTVLFYLSPANIKDTAFLTYDYKDTERDDDQWLYLPAARKIRRISSADRGDYFLGTDLSYEDIKNENKPNLSDYTYKHLGKEMVDSVECLLIEATPVSEKVARELGYGKVVSRIDPKIWMVRKSEFWDIKGNPLKVVEIKDIKRIDGIWTSHEILAENHKTRHKTRFIFSDVDYKTAVDDKWFETRQLKRGL